MNAKNYMVIIVGPTGVGKTDLAEELASKVPAEIVNMDMGQFYTPLTIGTAKPDWKNSPIKQHLFDCVDEPRNVTVVEYRQMLLATLQDIWSRGNLPILVGGSSFYLKSVFYPPCSDSVDDNIQNYDHEKNLWQLLHSIDPIRAAALHAKDTYRIERALNIWYATGKKPSECKQLFTPPANFLLIFLTRDREELYTRINTRVECMMEQGWQQEGASLQGTAWEPFLKQKKLIGYSELFDYLAGDQDEQRLCEVIMRIQQRTRNYAKRQYTFWKKLESQLIHDMRTTDQAVGMRSHVTSLNLTCTDLTLYIKQLLNQLRKDPYGG